MHKVLIASLPAGFIERFGIGNPTFVRNLLGELLDAAHVGRPNAGKGHALQSYGLLRSVTVATAIDRDEGIGQKD